MSSGVRCLRLRLRPEGSCRPGDVPGNGFLNLLKNGQDEGEQGPEVVEEKTLTQEQRTRVYKANPLDPLSQHTRETTTGQCTKMRAPNVAEKKS